jgi:uncharacterized protein DUF5985
VLKESLYILCILSSVACTLLLFRSYLQNRVRLLLWGTVCFIGLSINNILLFLDLVLFPHVDLRWLRIMSSLTGMLFLVYGLIWDSED